MTVLDQIPNVGREYKPNLNERISEDGKFVSIDICYFSKIVQQYHKARFEKAGLFWCGQTVKVEEQRPGLLLIDRTQESFITPSTIGSLIRANDYTLLEKIIEQEKRARARVYDEIHQFEFDIYNNQVDSKRLNTFFEAFTDYGSLRLDFCFPRRTAIQVINQCLGRSSDEEYLSSVDLNSFFIRPDGINYQDEIYLGLVELAQCIADGYMPCFSSFIENLGYLTKNDITLGRLEDPEKIKDNILDIARSEPFVDYRHYRDEFYRKRMGLISLRKSRLKWLIKIAKKEGLDDISARLLKFAGVCGVYDDEMRRIRTKAYQLFAKIITINHLDVENSTINDLV